MPEPFRPISPTASPRADLGGDVAQRPDVRRLGPPRWTKRSFSVRASRPCTRKLRATLSTEISPTSMRPRVRPAMERVGEHPVPAGPLAVRWLAYELEEQRAGVATQARLRFQNAGTAPWRSRGREGVQLAYHWLDPLGNAIVWDGERARLFHSRAARRNGGTRLVGDRAAALPGAIAWRSTSSRSSGSGSPELGSAMLDLPIEVRPLIEERRLAVSVHGPVDAGARSRALRTGGGPGHRGCGRGSRTSFPASCPRPIGRASSSTRTPRATRQSGRRSTPSPDRPTESRRLGAQEAGATRASASRCSSVCSWTVSSPMTHEGLPAFPAHDGLFEGRAVIRLRSRSGRREAPRRASRDQR